MGKNTNRRRFLSTAGLGLLTIPLSSAIASSIKPAAEKELAGELNPVFQPSGTSKITLNIRDFGATGDGKTKDTAAIQQCIDRCSVLGGGEIIVPEGNYLTGAIALRNNTTLRFEKNAVIIGSPDLEDYLVTQVRWEGKWIQGYSGLVYAVDVQNIGITGPGKIIGNDAVGGRPTAANPLRRPALIEPIGCTNINFNGFSTSYHLMWSLHFTYCNNISIKNLNIRSTGGNGDGIDIDSCKTVTIDGCDIATGDDCISLKSGRGMEGFVLKRPTEDVKITNCTFADSIFACIGIGSETSGGIRNVSIEKCKFTHANTFALYIKSRTGRGAFIENITVNDVDVLDTKNGFLRFNIVASGLQDQVPVPGNEGIPTIKNFRFTNIRVNNVPELVDGTGIHPNKPLDGFVLNNVTGTCLKGISLANIRNAQISNIKVTCFSGSLLNTSNVKGKGLENAVAMEAKQFPDPVPEPQTAYQLH